MTPIQTKILDIYKVFRRICLENDWRYYSTGGTTIGAVRHQGFIPWDDDMDVAMPIDDMVQLIRSADAILPPNIRILYPGNAHHCRYPYIKLIDTDTTLVETSNVQYKDCYGGVWLDIFPIMGIPDDNSDRENHRRKILNFSVLSRYLRTPLREFKISRYPLWILINCTRLYFTDRRLWDKYVGLLSKYPLHNGKDITYIWTEAAMSRSTFPAADFLNAVNVKFEDTEMVIPSGYDKILTSIYGDYMQLPPEEKRTSVHDFSNGIVDLDTPYSHYL